MCIFFALNGDIWLSLGLCFSDRVVQLDHPRPPVSALLSAVLLFLYVSAGRDRTMIWDIHWNEDRLC